MPEHFRRHLIIGLVIALIVLPIALRLLRLGPRTWLKRLLTGGAYFLLAVACAAVVILLLIRFGSLEMGNHWALVASVAAFALWSVSLTRA